MTGTTGSSTAAAGAASSDNGAAGPAGAGGKVTPGAAGAWRRLGYILPVAVFLIVAAGLAIGLTRDPSTLPSALIDKPVPVFKLPPVASGGDGSGLSTEDLKGKVQLVNVFASWCGPCRVEHPVLMKLARDGVAIQGLNYKDKPEDAGGFLAELGDPYEKIGADANGRVGIDWGVYGVPETFVVDADGKIRHKHVGPIQTRDVEGLMAIIEDLQK
jgi:cytochrome c biogenesis protein CcmG, thiol:disulfide interchange protein DsbE